MIVSSRFLNFSLFMSLRSGNPSFAYIPTELLCFRDLKNSGQLPVQEVF